MGGGIKKYCICLKQNLLYNFSGYKLDGGGVVGLKSIVSVLSNTCYTIYMGTNGMVCGRWIKKYFICLKQHLLYHLNGYKLDSGGVGVLRSVVSVLSNTCYTI